MNEMIKTVSFAGTELDCVQKDGEVFVSLRRACEGIGIDYASQYTKLKEQHWAVVVMNTTTGSDGKNYNMTMINLDTLAMWLATIQSSRVAEEIRPQLEMYQKEVVKVIRQYFFPTNQAAAKTPAEMLLASVQQLVENERRQKEIEQRQFEVETKINNVINHQSVLNLTSEIQKKDIVELKEGLKDANAIPLKTMRIEMSEMIRKYASDKKMNFGKPWTLLYREFRHLYRIDLKVRAKNDKVPVLEWAEKHGQLRNLYILASEMFKAE